MKKYFLTSIIVSTAITICSAQVNTDTALTFFQADNKNIQYTGRINFSNSLLPKFWQPGVYIKAAFEGNACDIIVSDEQLYGTNHNYIEIVIDDTVLYRVQTRYAIDTIQNVQGLPYGKHTILICKNTEAGIGYLAFIGLRCKALLPLPAQPKRKLEFVGNSITCGTGSDISEIPCGKGVWYDQHNAYLGYGPTVARMLNAQWQLSSVSGIGLIHSCCDMTVTMPQVFDKLNMRDNKFAWSFKNYQPDAITICLGQNDGIQDSTIFCSTYIAFIEQIRSYYPNAAIICLTSPMGDETLTAALKNYLNSIIYTCNRAGDKKVYKYFFSIQYHKGCGGHPNLAEHIKIANELSAYLKKILGW